MLNQTLIDKVEQIAGKNSLQIHSEKPFISPENSSAVSEIVKLANREKFKILPVGSGSTLDWSKLSSENLVILKSDKLNKIKKVVPEDLYVILEAGFPLNDLNPQLDSFSLFYPLADTNLKSTMGGAVATNLKGKSGDKNVQTKDYVLALEVVDPEGRILKVGARTFKSVTGYDLPRLFVGSWGTLGFISEVSLRLVPAGKRKEYSFFIPDHSKEINNQNQKDSKTILSSRLKKSLDPNGVFFNLNSLP